MSEKNKKFKHTIKGKWGTIIIETDLKGLPLIIQDAYDNAVIKINKEKMVKSLKKMDDIVVDVSQKVLYAFPKDILVSYSSEEDFLKSLKRI